MTPPPAAVPPAYFIGGLACLILLLTFLIASIIVAVRSMPGLVRACAITTAAVCSVLSFLASILLLGGLLENVSGSRPASEAQNQVTPPTSIARDSTLDQRLVQAKDGSCQLFVPKPWLDAPNLNKDAVIGVADPAEREFAMVLTDTKELYHGSLSDYANDTASRMRDKLTAPQMDAPETITINGRSAIRQSLRGEYDKLKLVYVITYFESETRLYQLICWSLESHADSAKPDFAQIAQFFRTQ